MKSDSLFTRAPASRRRRTARPIAPTVRGLPPTRRGQESRQRILDAASQVFGEKGYFAASITDITGAADIALGAFYRYFTSKKELFIEVLDRQGQIIRQTTAAAITGATDRIDEEARGFSAFFSLVAKHPEMYRIAREAEFVEPDAFRRYYETIFAGYRRRLTDAMAKGAIRRIDPHALVACLVGIGDFAGMFWPYRTHSAIPASVFDGIMQFIRWGMDTRACPDASRPVERGRRSRHVRDDQRQPAAARSRWRSRRPRC
jgi:AcrR family transcriptional regulator